MTVLIIEDEESASERLEKLLLQIDPDISVAGISDSIGATIEWLNSNKNPDLIFADINLADGQSFEIFRQVDVKCPIIFTTAYDQFAIQAFKFNSIDYLLKPIKKGELEEALTKFKRAGANFEKQDIEKLLTALAPASKEYQKRLVVKFGQTIQTLEINKVAYFNTEEKITFAHHMNSKRSPLDQTLDELESILDPAIFFRINRQFIINIDAISSMFSYSKSRVKIVLDPKTSMDTIVSAERSSSFKEWLLGKK